MSNQLSFFCVSIWIFNCVGYAYLPIWWAGPLASSLLGGSKLNRVRIDHWTILLAGLYPPHNDSIRPKPPGMEDQRKTGTQNRGGNGSIFQDLRLWAIWTCNVAICLILLVMCGGQLQWLCTKGMKSYWQYMEEATDQCKKYGSNVCSWEECGLHPPPQYHPNRLHMMMKMNHSYLHHLIFSNTRTCLWAALRSSWSGTTECSSCLD